MVLLAVGHVNSGVDIVTLRRLSSIVFGAASLPLTYVLARRVHPRAGALATLATALCGSFVYWAFGGLETTLASVCVLWALIAVDNVLRAEVASYLDRAHTAVSVLAVITVRPEMQIVLGLFAD